MRLTELEPQFLQYKKDADGIHLHHVGSINDAQGIFFVCPKCFAENGNSRIGVHAVICWSKTSGTPDEAEPGPGRWRLEGTGYQDLSLMEEPGKSRSVLLTSGCRWHGFVTNGEVI